MSLTALAAIIAATMVGAFGAFYLKKGSERFSRKRLTVTTILTNWQFLLGGTLYVASIPIYLVALKRLPVSVAYPMTSMTYIWSAILASLFLDEHVTKQRWAGILLIIAGIVLVAL